MRQCLNYLTEWAQRIGMEDVGIDAAGNFRALLRGADKRRLIIGSHLDTVPRAGAFDGVLGVVMGLAIAESFQAARPRVSIECVGFSEEEGVRFGRPFIGSAGFVSGLDDDYLGFCDGAGVSVREALGGFGLDGHCETPQMHPDSAAYLEFHIEQGPVLEDLACPLGVVEAIAGQTRASVEFLGTANHAGTTPMNLRRDAFCAAAEWTLAVERAARCNGGLVATVGRVEVSPGVGNVVPGNAKLSLDVRHAVDDVRRKMVAELTAEANAIAKRRGLPDVKFELHLNQAAVAMDEAMVARAAAAIAAVGLPVHKLTSGAGHDAMIVAKRIPSAMIFLRSPGGVSHHPDESVLAEDVALALKAGKTFVENFV